MKKIMLTIVAALLTLCVLSQKKLFLRLYDVNGDRIGSGKLSATSDSGVILISGVNTYEVPFRKIRMIKTRRAAGHDILMVSLVIVPPAAVYGLVLDAQAAKRRASNNSLSPALGINWEWRGPGDAVAMAAAGMLVGQAAGGLYYILKKKQTFRLNGTWEQWTIVKGQLDLILRSN